MKSRFITFVLIGLLAVFAVGGCSNQQPDTGDQPSGDDTVATVDGETITQAQFDGRLSLLGLLFGPGAEEQLKTDETKQQILDEMIEEILLLKEAEARSIELDDETLAAEMEKLDQYLSSQFGDEKEINKQLEERNLAEGAIHDFFTKRLIIQELYEAETADLEVTDEEAQGYYEENQGQFTVPEQVHARHILVKTKDEALDIVAKLEAGEDFAELAKEFSTDDSNAEQGGDLGFFHRGVMLPSFEEAAFNLEVGQFTTEPVETTYGFHIIKVEERNDARVQDFEEVQEQVRTQILGQKKTEAFTQFIEGLKEEANIQSSF